MIRFRLRKGGRVELVVRKNGVTCAVVGRKRVRGHEGLNRVRFDGRVGGRPLPPGKYTISVVVVRAGSLRHVGTVAVEVVPSGRRLTPAQRTAPVVGGCYGSITPFAGTSVLADLAAPLAAAGALASGYEAQSKTSVPTATLGPSFRPPKLPVADGGASGWPDLLLFGAVAIAGAVMLIQVARFLRGSWDP